MKILVCLLAVLLVGTHGLIAQQIDLNAHLNIKPATGNKFLLQQVKTNKASVIIFYSPECPICVSMTKTVREMADSFLGKGIKFYLVYPGKYYSIAHLREFQKTYMLQMGGYRDDNNELVHILGATVNPQAFVINAEGKVIYSGKIDNWFEDIGKKRTITTEFFLRDALNSVLKGEDPAIKKTEPVGCFIN